MMVVLPRIVSFTDQPITGTDEPGVIPEPSAYWVTVGMRDPPHHSFSAPLYEKPPTPASGGGGWEEVPLPKRSSVLIWRGRPLMTMTLEVVINNLQSGRPVFDKNFRTLLGMYRPANHVVPPPVLIVKTQGDTVPKFVPYWVLTGMEWGEGVGDWFGNRVQQVLNLTFTEFREDERLQTVAMQRAAYWQALGQWIVRYSGESLSTIAARFHVKGGWRTLANMQPRRRKDPRETRKGDVIFYPTPASSAIPH